MPVREEQIKVPVVTIALLLINVLVYACVE